MRDDIRALPSVEYETDEDCISRERVLLEINRIGFDAFTSYDYYSNLYDFVDGLSSEESKRKTGKWIDGKCNRCGKYAPFWAMSTEYHCGDYCPNCGAKMEVDG